MAGKEHMRISPQKAPFFVNVEFGYQGDARSRDHYVHVAQTYTCASEDDAREIYKRLNERVLASGDLQRVHSLGGETTWRGDAIRVDPDARSFAENMRNWRPVVSEFSYEGQPVSPTPAVPSRDTSDLTMHQARHALARGETVLFVRNIDAPVGGSPFAGVCRSTVTGTAPMRVCKFDGYANNQVDGKFWMVTECGVTSYSAPEFMRKGARARIRGKGSTVCHASRASAETEAQRLAKLNPGLRFVVLEAVTAVRTETRRVEQPQAPRSVRNNKDL